ncbi:MAG TPA: VTT domain-containing protein [Thermoanaerobaculia bacterium]
MDFLREAFSFITEPEKLIRWGGYTAMAIVVFTETGLLIGFFLPGDSLLVTAGLLASQGYLDIVWLNVLLVAMAIAGDATGYWIGTRFGPALQRKKDTRFFKREHLIRTQLFYEDHGGKTIVIARFVPIVRTFAPVVAGIAGMSYRRFASYNVFGGLFWVLSMTMVGYLLGETIPGIEKHLEIVILVVIGLSLVPGFIHHWLQQRKKKAESREFGRVLAKMVESIHTVLETAPSTDAPTLARLLNEHHETLHFEDAAVRGLSVRAVEGPDAHLEVLLEEAPAEGAVSYARREAAHIDLARRFVESEEGMEERLGPAAERTMDVAAWHLPDGELALRMRDETEAVPAALLMTFTPKK